MRKPLQRIDEKVFKVLYKPIITFSLTMFTLFGLNAQTLEIVDECVCLNNSSCLYDGQFSALLRITDGGSGPWYIAEDSLTDFYVYPSPAPPALPDEFITGPSGVQFSNIGNEVFELSGIHIDGKGFWLKVTNGTDTLEVESSGCSYPHTEITGDAFVCPGQVSDYSTPYVAGNTYLWTLDHGGVITTSPNSHSVTVEWDDYSAYQSNNLTLVESSPEACEVEKTLDVVIEKTITLACNNEIFISLDANCGGELTADMFLEGMAYDESSYELEIQDSDGNLITPNILTSDMVGNSYMVTVIQSCTGNSCWSSMTVFDKTVPELKCQSDTVKCSVSLDPQDLQNGFPLRYYTNIYTTSNPYAYIATGSNGCSDVNLKYYDDVIEEDCGTDFTSTVYRTWLVYDQSGNFNSCVDTIKTTRTGLDEISYPQNWDGLPLNHAFIQACTNYPVDKNGYPDPSYTGEPYGPNCGNIMITYSDKKLNLCGDEGSSYKVLRHWLVMDMCTSESFDTLQIIAIMDSKSPYVSISGLTNDTLFVEDENYTCGSDVTLPVPYISDCSNTTYKVKYQLADANGDFPEDTYPYSSVPLVNGKYILQDVPSGLARVKYIVEDACGNTTEKIIFIKVIDNQAPQAVCDQHTNITLNEDGFAHLGKITFDDGSYDNCTSVSFKVRRMSSTCNPSDTLWQEGIDFCCYDVANGPVAVELQVTDEHGYSSSCMGFVNVLDQTVPTIVKCPTDGEVSCKFDYSDLSVFGTVRSSQSEVEKKYINDPEHGGNNVYFGTDGYATDNCDVSIVELTPYISISNCGTGTIKRYFKAYDSAGNGSATCTQTILVKDYYKYAPTSSTWPKDYTTTGCLDESILPDNLPSGYGWPNITNDDICSMVAVDYDDLVFEHIDGMCYKIMRKWRIIDWCQYSSTTNSGGYWEYVQNIIVNDNTKPVFTSGCTPSNTVSLGDCEYNVSFDASASDNCTESNDLQYHYEIKLFSDNTVLYSGDAQNFDANLSEGKYTVTWTAEDNCGNIGQCSQKLIIEDTKQPTPQCIEGLVTVLLSETGEVTINAADFNVNSFDDCTPSNYGACGCMTDLRFAFSSNVYDTQKTLTCDDIENGKLDTISLEMWVFDEAGNKDFCNTYIVLQDNSDVCPDYVPPHDTSFYNISGLVKMPNDNTIEDVQIDLTNENSEFKMSYLSSMDGEYKFENLADNFNYKLSASKENDYLNGLSTLDIVLIQKHLLGIKKFDNPFKYIAADINKSNSVSASDILELRKLILGELDKFSSNSSWRMFDSKVETDNISELYNADKDIVIGNLSENVDQNFIGVKVGDVNFSAEPLAQGMVVRNSEEVDLLAKNLEFFTGQELNVELNTESDINFVGTQFTIVFDPEKLVFKGFGNEGILLNEKNAYLGRLDEGIITVSYDLNASKEFSKNSTLLNILFDVKSNGFLNNSFRLGSYLTKAEMYTENQDGIETKDIGLRFDNTDINTKFEVFQNTPNPFSDKTMIGFNLPESDQVKIKIFDTTGKVVYEKQQLFQKGYNEFEISNRDLDISGVLYYQVESGLNSQMKKMILIK